MRDKKLDIFRGCLFGGAAGDALGYVIEFMSEKAIFERYGSAGITSYKLDEEKEEALISDDTQMTLFTASGLLELKDGEALSTARAYVAKTYQDWLYTQNHFWDNRYNKMNGLLGVPELYSRRAPGITCLSALEDAKGKEYYDDYIKNPRNSSKGCGGVMRVAPVALLEHFDIEMLDMEAAQIAAITHGHSLGYMPAAVLCHIINRIVFQNESKKSLKEIVEDARDTVVKLFDGDKHLSELVAIINRAIALSENNCGDLANIRALGEGWVAEETLAIAIYCSLRCEKDFSKGIIAAVNHNGDSDSTGAVTGNILGALHGYEVLDEKWKKNLECADVILGMADRMCGGY